MLDTRLIVDSPDPSTSQRQGPFCSIVYSFFCFHFQIFWTWFAKDESRFPLNDLDLVVVLFFISGLGLGPN